MELLPSISEWMSRSFSDLANKSPKKSLPQIAVDSPTTEEYISVMDPNRPPDSRTMTQETLDWIKELGKDIQDPKKVVKFLSEMAIDPTSYIPGVKIASTGLGAKAAFIGAFRPTASKLLPSVLKHLKDTVHAQNQHGIPITPLVDKLSDKELSKYGTPEFLLDKYLPSTKAGGNPDWLMAEEIPLSGFLKSPPVKNLAAVASDQGRLAKNIEDPAFKYNQSYITKLASGDGALEQNIRAYRDQITTKEPIFAMMPYNPGLPGKTDISAALTEIDSLVKQSKYTPEQLSKKSLTQLLGVAKEVEKEASKSNHVIADFTRARTQELNKAQKLPTGFVELKTKADFGAETHFMDHCIGAGGSDPNTGKFLPKWNPITGEELIHGTKFQNSGDIYYGLAERGSARYISYRPKGVPEVTVEIDKNGNIKQLYGKGNSPVPDDLDAMIRKAVKPIQEEMSGRSRIYDALPR